MVGDSYSLRSHHHEASILSPELIENFYITPKHTYMLNKNQTLSRLFGLVWLLTFTTGGYSQTLVNEDFTGETTGNVTTTASSAHYQIDNNTSCTASDGWRFSSSDGSGSSCSDCSGQRIAIEYGGSSCDQDAIYVSEEFTTSNPTINISFDYGYDDYDVIDQFIVTLYNETTSSIHSTLVSITADCDDCNYASNVTGLSTSDTYSVRVRYIGDYGWGATFDNLVVAEGELADDNPLQVGNGTSDVSDGMFDNYWENNKTQIIYTSAEVGDAKSITALQFNITQVAAAGLRDFDNFVIKMDHTTSSSYSSIAYKDMSGATTVFTSADYNMPSSTGWFSIDIDDFYYNGTDNLIIEIYWGDNGEYASVGTEYRYQYTSTSSTYRMVYGDDDYTTQPAAETRSYNRPNIKFDWTIATLPITLTSFEASSIDNTYVDIKWTTASEISCDYYILSRSTDGYIWQEIERVEGHGTTAQQHDYYVRDSSPPNGYIYYNLLQYDYDGQVHDEGIVTVHHYDPTHKDEIIATYTLTGQQIDPESKPTNIPVINIYSSGYREIRVYTD